jgi:hypothetical protein
VPVTDSISKLAVYKKIELKKSEKIRKKCRLKDSKRKNV